MAYPVCCVVRASIALPPGRSRFWATCGVTFRFRHSATKSAVSYALSHPMVTCLVPRICSSITGAASRSAVPLASNTSLFTIRPFALLYHEIPVVTQLGFFALAFARQLRIRVRFGLMRLVGPLLPVEIYRRVARIVRHSLACHPLAENSSNSPSLPTRFRQSVHPKADSVLAPADR